MPATGLAFRDDSAFVTDAAGDTYCIGDIYPTTRDGITFGFPSKPETRDRSTDPDPRLAGVNFMANDGTQIILRIDIAPATFDIRLAMGDYLSTQLFQYIQIRDNTTPVLTIDDTTGTVTGSFDDATGTEYTAANWVTTNAVVSCAFSSSIMNVVIGTPSAQTFVTTLAYLQFVAQAASNSLALRVLN